MCNVKKCDFFRHAKISTVKNKTNNHTKTFCQFELSFHLWKKLLEKLLYTFSSYKLVTMWVFPWSTLVPQHIHSTETTQRGLIKSPFKSSSCCPAPQHTAPRPLIIPSHTSLSLFKTLRTLYSPNLLPPSLNGLLRCQKTISQHLSGFCS